MKKKIILSISRRDEINRDLVSVSVDVSHEDLGRHKGIVVGSLLKESLLTEYQCMSGARTMECAGRSVLYCTCIFFT